MSNNPGKQKLIEHNADFSPAQIITIAEGVHVAVGFGLANSIMIEGDTGVIIIDTLESIDSAKPVKEAFDKISGNKPTKAIFYTHNHPDHTFGAGVFAGNDNPDIISFYTLPQELKAIMSIIDPMMYIRSMRMYGNLLDEEDIINNGIGPALKYSKDTEIALMLPTIMFSEPKKVFTYAGVTLECYHAPGETNDQIFIWLPEKKILLPADNFYKSFPNLYTIRGTANRDVVSWIKSLDKMRKYDAEIMIPHHTLPIVGYDKIQQALTNYRDAIQFVHDRTVYYINKGLTPDAIADKIQLPEHLANDPNLEEYYGTVAWSSRSIFDSYLGWYSGEARDLFPLPPKQYAENILELGGGIEAVLDHASKALKEENYQWALELSDDVLKIDEDNKSAKEIKVAALFAMGETQVNAPARHYLLTQMLECRDNLNIPAPRFKDRGRDIVRGMQLDTIFDALSVRLIVESCINHSIIVNFSFTDVNETFMVYVRRGVAEVQTFYHDSPDLKVTVDSILWKEIVTDFIDPVLAYESGNIQIIGEVGDFYRFINLFEPV